MKNTETTLPVSTKNSQHYLKPLVYLSKKKNSNKKGVGAIHAALEQHQETDALKKTLGNHVHQLQDALMKQEAIITEETSQTDASLSQQCTAGNAISTH